ncbi:hypothetical protein QA648_36695 (plasmid) [Rhizobium sp. CB3171]|nr:hypothetical protein [Rhizobium sp. CB3171]WFU07520.1 hypothetical protein QA648_36695 [Rhizobium sp. CB3171]
MPSIVGLYSMAPLNRLSTSARIRCFERLTLRPNDWLPAVDDAATAHWRRSILLVGGHGRLIGLLAHALERRRHRHRATVRCPTRVQPRVATLSALLAAYVRIMQEPSRAPGRNDGTTGLPPGDP